MNKTLARLVQHIWYKDPITGAWLMPLGFLYSDVVRFRKFLYKMGVLKSQRLPVPVVVVGNITVGGTGKTPLVIWMARYLRQQGFKPGIISRGYGGQASVWPLAVTADSDVAEVGDEAVLMAKQSGCPVVVGPLRVAAAQALLQANDCDVLLSDDGLQHYALARTLEIVVIDGERRFGNGYCLPAGPLREPINRLESVDMVIVNGEKSADHEFSMQLLGDVAVNLVSGEQRPLSAFVGIASHALAGIGNPQRFFNKLAAAGISCKNHPFPDHYRYQAQDINFGDQQPVLMTEKDAVKCRAFATVQHWSVPVVAEPEAAFAEKLLNLLKRKL